ncbi:MAG: tyrosine-type recombinase/integrase [Rhodobiaceae bacterium]|nr:tyrosine-type recombinase/integrase [Hoeflea sp.]MCC0052189.1 tyrosine-type recombinase/integrase [Rhodobiaceae bacterium]
MNHLTLRRGRWVYVRRVPEAVAAYDRRAPTIRQALGTDDRRLAMNLRDQHDRRNDRLWSALKSFLAGGGRLETGRAVEQIEMILGLDQLPQEGNLLLVNRMAALADQIYGIGNLPSVTQADALQDLKPIALGVEAGEVMVSELAEIWIGRIKAVDFASKSEAQRHRASIWPRRAVAIFLECCGDKPVEAVTAKDAQRVEDYWSDRLQERNPRTGSLYSADTANRCLETLGRMLKDFARHSGDREYKSPFQGRRFKAQPRRALPYSGDWIRDRILTGGDIKRMNRMHRAIFLACVESGCRLSEIVNLLPSHIRLDHEVPHIVITDYDQGDTRRELKTAASVREVPLVGVSLIAMQAFPEGFPALRDREDSVATSVGKFLKENNLLPPQQAASRASTGRPRPIHSLRHAFKDRLRKAGAGDEMVRYIGGWKREDQEYGEGFDLEAKAEVMRRAALQFDTSIMDGQAPRRGIKPKP